MQVILIDSAGLRETDCPIEAEGVRRAVAAAQQAHVVLHVTDAASGAACGNAPTGDAQPQRQQFSAALQLSQHAVHIQVLNKADLLPSPSRLPAPGALPGSPTAAHAAVERPAAAGAAAAGSDAVAHIQQQAQQQAPLLISCKSGQGIDQLLAVLRQQVAALVSRSGDDGMAGALVTRARHR